MKKRKEKLDILLFSSCGGHLVQLIEIAQELKKYNIHFIVNDRTDLHDIMVGKTTFIKHAERYSPWQLKNIFESFYYLLKFKPTIFLSTGASPAVWFGIIGRLLGVKIIFVESLSKIVTPSLTGRLMYFIANKMYVQWPNLKNYLPRSIFVGNLLR